MNTPFQDPFSNQIDDNVDLSQEVKRYLRFWPWFLAAILLSLSIAYIYLRYAPRIYQTSSKIKVLDESDGLELPTAAFIFKRSNINLENEIEILTSYRICEQVAKQLNLNTKFFEEGQIQTSQMASLPFMFEQSVTSDSIIKASEYYIYVNEENFVVENASSEKEVIFPGHSTYGEDHELPFEIQIGLNQSVPVGKTFIVKFSPLKTAVLQLKSKVKVEPIGDLSHLLKLSLNGESTQWNEKVLNTLVEVFNNDGIIDRQMVSKNTLEFIDDRFIFLAEELDSIEVSKKEFKQDNNLVYLESDAELGLQKQTTAEEQLFQIQNQIALANMVSDALTKSTYGEDNLLPANVGIESAAVNNLIEQYNSNVLQRDKLATSGGENNPIVQQINATLRELRANIDNSLNTYNNQLQVSLNQMQSRNRQFLGRVSRLPEKEKMLRAIERQQTIKESLYLLLLQKREEAAINLAITEPSVKIVEYALSSGPVSPKSNIVYAGAILAGLLLPFGMLYILFMLDTKIHEKEELANLIGNTPVIAEIPSIKKDKTAIFSNPNARTVLAESFRILGSNVKYFSSRKNGDKSQVILCTSTVKGEGKTFVSINLSLALSSIHKKVLLIGADLRNPQVHSYVGKNKSDNGLSNYLHDETVEWSDLLIKGFEHHENHHTIISGEIPPNPAHLLTNGRFEKLITEAKKHYDYIIVDTAPTILVTDTTLISHLADTTVYIARANFTDKKLLKFSQELKDNQRLKNMTYVLNGVGASKSYGYKYNYGYGYGYGNQES